MNFSLLGKGCVCGFVVKLVAANVIRQHIFVFLVILFYFLDNNKKRDDSLSHENHDKWSNVTPFQHFCSGFDHANLVSFFFGSNFLPKITFSNMYFFSNISTLNALFEKMIIFSPISRRFRIGHICRTGGDRCFL